MYSLYCFIRLFWVQQMTRTAPMIRDTSLGKTSTYNK
jgi:hypothetical protein